MTQSSGHSPRAMFNINLETTLGISIQELQFRERTGSANQEYDIAHKMMFSVKDSFSSSEIGTGMVKIKMFCFRMFVLFNNAYKLYDCFSLKAQTWFVVS